MNFQKRFRLFLLLYFLLVNGVALSQWSVELSQMDLGTSDSILTQFRTKHQDSARTLFDQWLGDSSKDLGAALPSVLYNRCVIACWENDRDFSDSLAKIVVEEYADLQSGFYRARALGILGVNSRVRGNFELAIDYFLKAQQVFLNYHKPFYKANGYLNLANVHLMQGNDIVSIEYYLKAQVIIDSMKNIKGSYQVRNLLVAPYRNLGLYDSAVKLLLEAQEYSKKFTGKDSLISAMMDNHQMGLVHRAIENYEKAKEHTQLAIELSQKLGNKSKEATFRNNLAGIYLEMNMPDSSLFHIYKVRTINNQLGRHDFHTDVNLAKAHAQLMQYDSALHYLEIAEQGYVQQGRFKSLLGVAYLRAENLQKMQHLDSALSVLLPYDSDSVKRKYPRYFMEILRVLSITYYANQDYQQAYLYQQRLSEHLSTKEAEERKKAERSLSAMQILKEWEYQQSLNEQKISQLEAEVELKKEKNSVILFSVVIIGLLALIAALYRNRSVKRKHELVMAKSEVSEQQLKQAQWDKDRLKELLEDRAKTIAEKNQMIEGIKSQVELVIGDGPEENTALVAKMKNAIDSKANGERNWESFLLYFDRLYPGFIISLKNKFPLFTTGEIRFCTLLFINLTTKEIAHILGMSPMSANSARYRLRKKMALKKDEDLVDILMRVWAKNKDF